MIIGILLFQFFQGFSMKYFIHFTVLLMCNCSLFILESPEEPVNPPIIDPLNLRGGLPREIKGIELSYSNYEKLFHKNFTYREAVKNFSRKSFFNRIGEIEDQYFPKKEGPHYLEILWKKDIIAVHSGREDVTIEKEYEINIRHSVTDSIVKSWPLEKLRVTFKSNSSSTEWYIYQIKDELKSTENKKTFFEPKE